MQSTNELLASWGVISPWVFPSLWGILFLFACARRRYGITMLLALAFASDLFLSYIFSQPTFTDGGDTVTLFSTAFPKQPVYTVASLLPTLVNFSLATVMAVLLRSTSKDRH
jgi:ABC-type branched-subunit amino acid transport system permease subunit